MLVVEDVIFSLTKLYSSDYRLFQRELRGYLLRVSRGHEAHDFFNFIDYFKAEFIVASYFYIDHINYFLSRLLGEEYVDIGYLLPHIIFISFIGDAFTKELLLEYLEFCTGRDSIILEEAILSLSMRLSSIEDGVESLRFYPLMGIEDSWE